MIINLSTLYIVVLLISACMAMSWGVLWRYYPTIGGSGFWMLANLLSAAGGTTMAVGEPMQSLLLVMAGNAMVISGFWMVWCGIRHLQGLRSYWEIAVLAGAVTVILLLLVQESRIGRNTVYTVGQAMPMVAAAVFLLRRMRRGMASVLTALALVAGAIGNGVRLGSLVAHQEGLLATAAYNQFLFVTMLVVIFSGLTRNLGLLLLVMDRLRRNLQKLAAVDDLTGLPNRRYFMGRILEEQERAHRREQPFSLMIIDIDRFKQINDTHGHAAGDACLLHFSRLVSERLRATDVVARMGGDEFCVLLPETLASQAAVVAQDLVSAVRAEAAEWRDVAIPMTLSIGIADWRPARSATISDLMHDADLALYRAKRRGRDQFAVSPDAIRAARVELFEAASAG